MAEQLWLIAGQVYLFRENELRLVLEYILGYIQQHRAGSTGLRHMDCLSHGTGNVPGIQYKLVVFRNRDRDAGDIDFLECILAYKGGIDLSGDSQHRY